MSGYFTRLARQTGLTSSGAPASAADSSVRPAASDWDVIDEVREAADPSPGAPDPSLRAIQTPGAEAVLGRAPDAARHDTGERLFDGAQARPVQHEDHPPAANAGLALSTQATDAPPASLGVRTSAMPAAPAAATAASAEERLREVIAWVAAAPPRGSADKGGEARASTGPEPASAEYAMRRLSAPTVRPMLDTDALAPSASVTPPAPTASSSPVRRDLQDSISGLLASTTLVPAERWLRDPGMRRSHAAAESGRAAPEPMNLSIGAIQVTVEAPPLPAPRPPPPASPAPARSGATRLRRHYL